ncbi:MAG TPA: hypothetical protein VJ204_15560 [Solirubrobacterales bacterium]|nr:hypothetical protein [Solirubrobacterales bacterium]
MKGRRTHLIRLWFARWGFALMVAGAIGGGFVAALAVNPPATVPAVALNAASVYRLEVGGVLFAGLYIAALAFALAVQNRGFTEIGSGGIRAQDLAVTLPELIAANEAVSERLSEAVENIAVAQRKLERSAS